MGVSNAKAPKANFYKPILKASTRTSTSRTIKRQKKIKERFIHMGTTSFESSDFKNEPSIGQLSTANTELDVSVQGWKIPLKGPNQLCLPRTPIRAPAKRMRYSSCDYASDLESILQGVQALGKEFNRRGLN